MARGKKQYVQFVGRGLVGVSADDGKFLWGYNKIANSVANVATPIVQGDEVFVAAAYEIGCGQIKTWFPAGGGICAEEVYTIPANKFQNHHGGMVLVDGCVYAGSGQMMGLPICLDWNTGKVKWGGDRARPRRRLRCRSLRRRPALSPLRRRHNGPHRRFADGYKLCGTFTIPDVASPSWPQPVIADGKLYLANKMRSCATS